MCEEGKWEGGRVHLRVNGFKAYFEESDSIELIQLDSVQMFDGTLDRKGIGFFTNSLLFLKKYSLI